MCSECCACHAKRARHARSVAPARKNEAAPKSITRRRSSGDLYEGAPNSAPATQNEPGVLQALRLSRKRNLRCSKCCACHAKRGGAEKASLGAGLPQTSVKVLQVLGLPRKTNLRCSECCVYHAKQAVDGDA